MVYCLRVERYVYTRTSVSVSYHYTNRTQCAGLEQSEPHHHLIYSPLFFLYQTMTDITIFNAEVSTQKYITSTFFCIRLWLILPFSMQNFLHKSILPPLLPVSYYSLYHHFQFRSWCKRLSVTSRRQTSFQTCYTHNFR